MLQKRNVGTAVRRRDALLSFGAGLIAAAAGHPAMASVPLGGDWSTLHLDRARYLTFPARINGTQVNALIDSGATRSVIKDRFALELGLPYRGASLVTAFTSQVSGSLYRVDDLQVAGLSVPRIDIGSYNMGALEGVAGSIPLVVGQDVLRGAALDVEFGRDRARFVDRHAAAPAGASRLHLAGTDHTLPALPIAIEGRIRDFAFLDLGSNLPLAISRDYAIERGLLKARRVSTALSVGIEGPTVDQVLTVAEARIGPFTLRDVPAFVVEHWRLAYPIAIGWPFFKAFDARYDLGGGAVWLASDPARLAQGFDKDRSGLGAVRMPDHLLIRHVAYRSPAWQAGLREGDAISTIDGQAVNAAYPATRLGAQPAGTRIALGLDDRRAMTLVLADYF